MSDIITVRDAVTVAAEIKVIVRQTQQVVLSAAVEIGKRLEEAKELVPHGEWGKWLETEVNFSKSTANNMMRLYREYGQEQQKLFGGNLQAFGDLSYTKALALLAVPEEEREEFAKQANAAEASTRELEQAIRERNQAQDAQAKAEKEKKNAETSEANALKLLQTEQEKAEALRKQLTAAEQRAAEAVRQANAAQDRAVKAEQEAGAAMADLATLRENPEVPESVMEKIRAEAVAGATKKAAAEAQQESDAAKEYARQLEAKAAELEQRLEEAQRQAKMSDPLVTEFKLVMQDFQKNLKRLVELKAEAKTKNLGAAQNLEQALAGIMAWAAKEAGK